MSSEINYHDMSVRLDLLLRMILHANYLSHKWKLDKKFQDEVISLIATTGTFQTYKLRTDGQVRYGQTENQNSHAIGQVIVVHFQDWSRKIYTELQNSLPLLHPSIEERMIQECISELMITLGGLFAETRKESVHG